MLVSVVVPEKLPEYKWCDEENEEEEHAFSGVLTYFYSNPDMTICNFLMSVCSFCRGQHTDTNI